MLLSATVPVQLTEKNLKPCSRAQQSQPIHSFTASDRDPFITSIINLLILGSRSSYCCPKQCCKCKLLYLNNEECYSRLKKSNHELWMT